MFKYQKKPVIIEAVQWNGRKIICPPGPDWFATAEETGVMRLAGDTLLVETSEGAMSARPGDWIIRGVEGEIYPCKNSVFAKTYDKVTED